MRSYGMPPTLSETWHDDDDWTGISDPQERRKRQNRIHQRAYRKKRHLKRVGLLLKSPHNSVDDANALSTSLTARRVHSSKYDGNLYQPLLSTLGCHEIIDKALKFVQKALLDWSMGHLSLTNLPIVTRLNAFDALIRNAFILQIPVEILDSEDGPSPFTITGTDAQSAVARFPPHLCPTTLQQSVKHHPWLDLLPVPQMRDNILKGLQEGRLDEDELSHQLVCDLLNFETTSGARLMIWGDSWDINGWEFSPEFFVKWASLLEGCPEVLQATNYWRAKRREPQLGFVLG